MPHISRVPGISTPLNQDPLPPGAVKVAVLGVMPQAEDAPQVVLGLSLLLLPFPWGLEYTPTPPRGHSSTVQ